jgi:hypothetical protein
MNIWNQRLFDLLCFERINFIGLVIRGYFWRFLCFFFIFIDRLCFFDKCFESIKPIDLLRRWCFEAAVIAETMKSISQTDRWKSIEIRLKYEFHFSKVRDKKIEWTEFISISKHSMTILSRSAFCFTWRKLLEEITPNKIRNQLSSGYLSADFTNSKFS